LVTQHMFFFSIRRRHTSFSRDWSSDVCSSDLPTTKKAVALEKGATAFFVPAVPALQFANPDVTEADQVAVVLQHNRTRSVCAVRSEERRVGKDCMYTCALMC